MHCLNSGGVTIFNSLALSHPVPLQELINQLHRLLRPFILRRLKVCHPPPHSMDYPRKRWP